VAIEPGQVIGTYRVVEKIGQGGMGAVYKAEDTAIRRSVVLKVLATDMAGQSEMLQRFRREVEMIASLEHPHILPVYEFGEVEGDPYIAMRYMRGGSLLEHRGRSREELLRIFDQVAEALDFAHDRDVIHRDLKPGNVLLDEQGNAYLADFGLAKTMEGSRDLTATGGILGTPAYMSPEQARGEKLDRRSDVYAFAVMAYEALSGQLPFEASTPMEFIYKHLLEPPRPISSLAADLPPAVDRAFQRGLSKDREPRPARATEFMGMLREALLAAGQAGATDAQTVARDARAISAGATTKVSPGDPGTEEADRAQTSPIVGSVAGVAGGSAVAPGMVSQPGASAGGAAATGAVARGALAGGAVRTPDVVVHPGAAAGPIRRPAARRWLLPAVAAILVIGGGLAAVATLAARKGLVGPRVHTYPVGDSPRALLALGDSVWVANGNDDTIARLAATDCDESPDPCGQALDSFSVPRLPVGLASDGTWLWIASAASRTLTQLDPTDGRVIAQFPLLNVPTAMIYADGFLWTANEFADSVTKISNDGAVVGDFPVESAPRALISDGDVLWVASEQDDTVTSLAPDSGEVIASFPVAGGPVTLEFDGTTLWVALSGSAEVVALERANGSIVRRVTIGGRPVALLFEGETLWVADQAGNSIIGLDVATAEQRTTLTVEGAPFALAWQSCGAGCGDLWVASDAADTVSRIRFP